MKISIRVAIVILCTIILLCTFGSFFYTRNPHRINLTQRLLPPSFHHPCGTDHQGRDVLSRIIYGGRTTIWLGVLSCLLALIIGTFLGTIAGYFGGPVDRIITYLIDTFLAFPYLLLALAIAVVLPGGWFTVIIALTLAGWPGFARFTRGLVLELRKKGFIETAFTLGANHLSVILKHILPNIFPLLLVTTSLRIGMFMLGEASLSFLGLGINPPHPTWGGMINYGRNYLETGWWISFFPGIFLSLVVISCNLIGEHFRDYLTK